MRGSAKSARRVFEGLLALLAPRRLAHLEKSHTLIRPTLSEGKVLHPTLIQGEDVYNINNLWILSQGPSIISV
jgi:hypothetical protein